MPRAEIFVDLITEDHKVLSEESESRNNHRYAVVVQDLATQWLQSYLCKTKTSLETQKNLMKFLEPTRKPKVIYTGNSLELGKSCEELSWKIIVRQHHTDQMMPQQKENVSDSMSIWRKQSSSTDQFIRANKCVKIRISNSK